MTKAAMVVASVLLGLGSACGSHTGSALRDGGVDVRVQGNGGTPAASGGGTGGAWVSGTGGATSTASTEPLDGGTAVDSTRSGPPPDFCSGPAKLSHRGQTATVPVTAFGPQIAACCVAVYGVFFHGERWLGSDYRINLLRIDRSLPPGEYLVGGSSRPLHVLAKDPVEDLWSNARGSVRIAGEVGGADSFQASLCLEVVNAAPNLAATWIHVPAIAIPPAAWSSRFQIYLLEDPSLPTSQAALVPLDELVLAQRPLYVDLTTLLSVERSSGLFRLVPDEPSAALVRRQVEGTGSLNLPFVVVADGARIYMGAFVSALSSYRYPGPIAPLEELQDDRLTILGPAAGDDPRWDPRIVKVLSEASRLLP